MTEIKSCTNQFFPELCGVNVIVDPQGSLGTDRDRVLIIGQKGDTGTAGDNTLHRVLASTRNDLFGLNSMLNVQIDDFEDIAQTAEIWAFVLPNTGTNGEAEIEVTGVDTATVSGAVYLWVNGQSYQVAFNPTIDDNDTLATKIQAVISATDPTLTVTVAANVVSIETQIDGEIGGFLDVRTEYGRRPDLASSSEVTLTVTEVAATGLPNLTPIVNLTEGFEFVVNPYTDDNSQNDVAEYLCSQWSGGANSRAFGVFYGDAPSGEVFARNRNNGLVSYIGVNGALTPGYRESSSYAALAYNHLNFDAADKASSMTGQVFPGMLAPEESDVFSDQEKAGLVEAGLGYVNITRVNDVNIGRAVTTFTVNDNGSLNDGLRDVNIPSMLAYISSYMRENLQFKYNGYSFRTDGVVGGNSTKVATIPAVRNFIISLASQLSDENVIQDIDGFIDSLTLSVSADGCIEIQSDPNLVKPFCCTVITLRTL